VTRIPETYIQDSCLIMYYSSRFCASAESSRQTDFDLSEHALYCQIYILAHPRKSITNDERRRLRTLWANRVGWCMTWVTGVYIIRTYRLVFTYYIRTRSYIMRIIKLNIFCIIFLVNGVPAIEIN